MEKKVQSESRASITCYRTLLNCYAQACNSDGPEQKYNCIAGITFVAFTMEAMINHYGRELFPDWNIKEKRRGREKNHSIVFNKLGVPELLNSKEYLSILEAYSFRDGIVHGKTVDEELEMSIKSQRIPELVNEVFNHPTSIEQKATIKNLSQYIDSLYDIERKIEKNLDYHIYPLSVTGLREW